MMMNSCLKFQVWFTTLCAPGHDNSGLSANICLFPNTQPGESKRVLKATDYRTR